MSVNHEECEFAGLDPTKVASIARRLGRIAREAEALDLTIFGGSGSGSLRWNGEEGSGRDGNIVVASIDGGSWDGGDGGEYTDDAGFTRGEGL